ncbi:MAG TPA: aminotransferase class I/II-fold pyridoxal phosphate-dependent enzyme, partial [Streptosporangiaceae bacterium]
EYLENHPWRNQVKVFRELYRERRDATLDALSAMMPAGVTWTHPRGGFYVWMTLPPGMDSKAMIPRALTHKVAYVPGVGFYSDGSGQRELRLSYCYPEPARIREGIRRLAAVLREESELRQVFGAQSSTMDSRRRGLETPGPELA